MGGSSSGSSKWRGYKLVAATALALTLSTRLYAAFQSYTDFLVQGGIFHWLCFEEEIKLDLNGEPYCSAQLDSIRSLIEFQSGAEFVGSAIAGVIMDVYSPFSLLQVGGVFSALYFIFLAAGNDRGSGWKLYTGSILGGWSINMLCYPALLMQQYFPGQGAFCVAVLLGAQCLSTAVMPILVTVRPLLGLSFSTFLMAYLSILVIPSLILYYLALPRPDSVSAAASVLDGSSIQEDRSWKVRHDSGGEISRRRSSLSDSVVDAGAKLKTVLDSISSIEYILLIVVDTILYTCALYYQMDCAYMMGTEYSSYLSRLLPLQAVFGLMWSYVIDRTKTPVVMLLQLILYCVIFLSVLGGGWLSTGQGNRAWGYLQGVIAVVTFSGTFGLKYTYTMEEFPKHLVGTLNGLAGALGILAVFIVNYLRVNDKTASDAFFRAQSLALFCCASIPIPLYMWYRSGTKKQRAFKTQ